MTLGAGGPDAPRGGWRTARVVSVDHPVPDGVRLRLDVTDRIDHMPGQHYVVRLTAPDGYTASRSYSVASAPDSSGEIELTVERLEDGEVSTFLHDVAEVGDELEVRGPIGGWFVWDGTTPALLVGGGSGVVPLMAMLRLARGQGAAHPLHLVVSVRSPEELLYAGELPGADVTVIYTRRTPAGAARPPGRLTLADLPPPAPRAYVCGSSGFADAATALLIRSGVAAGDIRVERFGPTGAA
jgi:ferredoxin-NADP reductase